MDIKETPDFWVLRDKKRLRIPDIKKASSECATKIEAEIRSAGLEVDGPWVFISRHLPKDGKTFFDWEICRPVKKPAHYNGALELAHLEPIMVASRIHQGPLRTLFTKGYAPLVAELDASQHIYSGESREVYHEWNGPEAPRHTIEIQFGLSR